ncbi:uncharacterized, partial [Tachysurus ichikawai]
AVYYDMLRWLWDDVQKDDVGGQEPGTGADHESMC